MADRRHKLGKVLPKRPAATKRPRPEASTGPVGLVAALVHGFDPETGAVELWLGAERARAALDPSVSPVVLRTAAARGERVVVQREAEGWVVLGVLRTTPTPGVDEGDEYVIRARRVQIDAGHEFSVVSGAASFIVRAYGFVETLAEDITTRAAGVHKVVGRMLRLN